MPTRITGGSSVRLCVRGCRQVCFNPMQLHLKYVATLPCNLLLIACFFDNVSQGSVARSRGTINNH